MGYRYQKAILIVIIAGTFHSHAKVVGKPFRNEGESVCLNTSSGIQAFIAYLETKSIHGDTDQSGIRKRRSLLKPVAHTDHQR